MALEALPGKPATYLQRAGDGERYLFANALATTVARGIDTGGLYDATFLSGGKGDVLPFHSHPSAHKIYFVYDGRVSLGLNGGRRLLVRGDFISVPPETAHDLRFHGHRSRVLEMAVGGDAAGLYPKIGAKTKWKTHAPVGAPQDAAKVTSAAIALGLKLDGAAPQSEPEFHYDDNLPEDVRPYALEAGEGLRLVAADQVYTMLGLRRNTTKDFFAVLCEGPTGKRIPEHYHDKHSEIFVGVDGRVSMTADGEEVVLGPGDFLQVAAGTRHTYKLEDSYTRFFSILVPGLFEPFFFTIGEPYANPMFPHEPGPLGIDRVMKTLATLDVKFTGVAGVGMRTAGWFMRRFGK